MASAVFFTSRLSMPSSRPNSEGSIRSGSAGGMSCFALPAVLSARAASGHTAAKCHFARTSAISLATDFSAARSSSAVHSCNSPLGKRSKIPGGGPAGGGGSGGASASGGGGGRRPCIAVTGSGGYGLYVWSVNESR